MAHHRVWLLVHRQTVAYMTRLPSALLLARRLRTGRLLHLQFPPCAVTNGDLGTIASIKREEQEVVMQFAERQVNYDYADLSELALVWAITVHKSQEAQEGKGNTQYTLLMH